jgi:threonine aldolase
VSTPLHDPARRGFGSDNQSGAHPAVLEAMVTANLGHVRGYGADPYTEALGAWARSEFGAGAAVFPVFGGTGANVVGLAGTTGRWQSVLCADSAHITTDEGNAPEQSAGLKLVPVPSVGGKLTPERVVAVLDTLRPLHHGAGAVVSLTQSTELGTVYTPDELAALTATAHSRGLRVHVDGARISNAAAFLGVSLRALTSDVGVDVLSLGGTKNGLAFGEAVVVLDPTAAPGVVTARKGLTQLGSKLRFLSAQLLALYGGGLWLELAGQANLRAAQLADGLLAVPGVTLVQPVQSNVVLVQAPAGVEALLAERFGCQRFTVPVPAVRLVCSWDTTQDDVDAVLAAVSP